MQVLGVAIFGLLSLMTFGAAEADERLSGAEIVRLFPGAYSGIAKDGTKVWVEGEADGTLRGTADETPVSGRWWVKGERLCIEWVMLLISKKRCSYVVRDGGWYLVVKANGKERMRFRR